MNIYMVINTCILTLLYKWKKDVYDENIWFFQGHMQSSGIFQAWTSSFSLLKLWTQPCCSSRENTLVCSSTLIGLVELFFSLTPSFALTLSWRNFMSASNNNNKEAIMYACNGAFWSLDSEAYYTNAVIYEAKLLTLLYLT